MARPPRPFLHRLHDYFFPHVRNNYRPHFFGATSLAVFVIGIFVLEGAYLAQIKLVFPNTNFLASVLPGTLVALTNEDRATNDAPAVTESAMLDQAATLAAEDMASRGYFAHVSPSGVTPWDWLNQVGYKYSYAGENLAVNFNDSSAVEQAWMASPTHHANIVKAQYTQIGVGTANGMYQGQDTTFVVTFFATPVPTVSPVARAAPKPVIAVSSTPPASVPVSVASSTARPAPEILGAATAGASIAAGTQLSEPSLLSRMLASPLSLIETILMTLLVLVLALFAIAAFTRLRIPHPHVLAGSALLIALTLGTTFFDQRLAGPVHLPSNNQSASVISAFGSQ